MTTSSPLQAAIAAHRFGLGEADLAIVGSDARGWLAAQIGPADAPRGTGLLDTRQALEHVAAERELRRQAKNPPPGMTAQQLIAGHYREVIAADARSRLATAATDDPSVRRAAAGVLDQPLHGLGAEGQHARPGRRVRARRDPAAHRRPLRDLAVRLDDASGDAALPRQHAVGRAALAHRRARGAARIAARRDGARHRHQREPRARSARAAHARRRERARRHLHAGRRHRLRGRAERLARRPGRRHERRSVRCRLARAWSQDRSRQSLRRRPRCVARRAARPRASSGDGALRLDQARAPLRRRRAAAGPRRSPCRDLSAHRRPARRGLSRADRRRRGLDAVGRQS